MKKIDIIYDESKETYLFECPFCNKKVEVNDGELCEHVIYAYEEVNSRPLYIADVLYDEFSEILKTMAEGTLEMFDELWEFDYAPCEERFEDPEEWDSAREDFINYYMDECFSLKDFNKLIGLTSYKDKASNFIIASTEEGFDYGQTSYILCEK